MNPKKPFLVCLSLSLAASVMGCAADYTARSSEPNGLIQLGHIKGSAYGGRQPIVGAHVFVFAASTQAYGGAGIAASSPTAPNSNASVSLLTTYATGAFPSTLDTGTTSPTKGDYYVTTDTGGNFQLTGEYTCTQGQDIYLYSSGGDAGAGSPNPQASLMAVLGTCPSSGTMAALTPEVSVNEVSTVAAAYALAGFATDPLHIGDDEGVSGNTYASLAKTGMVNAFANAAQLYDIGSFLNSARSKTPAGNGTVPQAELDSLANSLAACVNSTGSGSTGCAVLTYATLNGTSTGAVATDTAAAAINVAHYPANNVSAIYTIAGGFKPFNPTLSSAPNNWTMGINYTGGGMNLPYSIAIDGSGNAWVANNGNSSVTKLSSSGTAISPSTGYAGGGLSFPYSLAIDGSGNAWVTNQGRNSVTKLSSSGTVISPSTGYTGGGLSVPTGIVIDGSGNAWAANNGNSSVAKLSSSGTAISPSTGYTGGGLNQPYSIAIDGSGNAWVANNGNNSVTKLSSSGTVISPSTGYTGGGLSVPYNLAIDGSGNAWVAAYGHNSVTKLSNSGTAISSFTGYTGGGLNQPVGIAIDGSGNAWAANYGNSSVTELSSSGTAISGSNGYIGGSVSRPYSLAIDGSGNVWIANSGNNSVTELMGAATPVITPICAGLPALPSADGSSKLGTRP